ncbi:MAG TPA: hypothetical protein VHV74_15690, partial [Pseudonocardiaceae bacterium]|nr:hypothetical protein [Pseudonocardiaceae bacterium]
VQPGRDVVTERVRMQPLPPGTGDRAPKVLPGVLGSRSVSRVLRKTHSHSPSEYRRLRMSMTHVGGGMVRMPASDFVLGWTISLSRVGPVTTQYEFTDYIGIDHPVGILRRC